MDLELLGFLGCRKCLVVPREVLGMDLDSWVEKALLIDPLTYETELLNGGAVALPNGCAIYQGT